MLCDQGPASLCQIRNQRIDHATNRFVDQPPVHQFRVLPAHGLEVAREDTHRRQLLDRDQRGAQAVVHVVIVVGNLVGQVGQLRLHRRPMILQESAADLAQFLGILDGAVLEYAFAGLKTEIQSVERPVTQFQQIDHPQRLQVVLEPAVFLHAFV